MRLLPPLALTLLMTATASAMPDSMLLCDFAGDASTYRVESAVNAADEGDALVLGVDSSKRGSVRIRPASGVWDCVDFTRLQVDIENTSDQPAHFRLRALNPEGNDWSKSVIGDGFVQPKQRKTFNVYFYRRDKSAFPALKPFEGMNGVPGGYQSHWHTIEPGDIRSMELSSSGGPLRVRSIRATHPVVPAFLRDNADAFFPFVDRYGQYRWEEWDGKVTGDEQLAASAKAEVEDLRAHPPRVAWDSFGGWRHGPELERSTFFRAEKVDGKWWLVTPEGRLFWSHGANSVGYGSAYTRIAGREGYFADLPSRGGEYAFAWRGNDFDHLSANLHRTFGPQWKSVMPALTHDRMQSWGMNTIGAWSDNDIIAGRRTPYTAMLHPSWQKLIDRVPDVFHPQYEAGLRESIKRAVGGAAGDPWCIGFFIDNELLWGGDPLDFIASVLAAPAQGATKRELVSRLQTAFPNIADFNAKVGTSFTGYDALLASRESIRARSLAELRNIVEPFYAEVAERYFKANKSALAEFAPGQMYLGCRFHVQNKILVSIAAKYCDVLSFNRYEHSVASFDSYGEDKPTIISEFHFGALDAGMLGTGLKSASDRYDRADKYVAYVDGAIDNPRIVGTHWFAFCPQSITGRGDGENFNTGLFDICNQPYPEMRTALRSVADRMYDRRGAKK